MDLNSSVALLNQNDKQKKMIGLFD